MAYKKAVCILLAGVITAMLPACRDTEKKTPDTSSPGGWTSSLPLGSEAPATSEEFNNVSSEEPAPTPGEESSGGFDNNDGETPTPGDGKNDSSGGDVTDDGDSLLKDKKSLRFIYEGDGYSYGITQDGAEMIAFRDGKGGLLDTIAGGGRFSLDSTAGLNLLTAGEVTDFEQTIDGNNIALVVTYRPEGVGAENAVLQTMYTFYRNHISVEARVSYTNEKFTISASKSRLNRVYSNRVVATEKKANFEWVYPDNNDFPYKKLESWVTVNRFDGKRKAYTFLRSADIPDKYFNFNNRYPETYIPLFFEDGKGVSYTVKYDFVLDTESEGRSSDYISLFEGKGSDYAAGIAPVKKNDDQSTVFVGNAVDLNLNVTNLADQDIEFSARYDVRDYYGNIVDAGIFINSTAFKNRAANRKITVKANNNYGMFYVNFMVITKLNTYREMYPLMLVPQHTYKYNATSPFGINQIRGGPGEQYMDYINVAGKIGIAVTRGAGPLSVSYMDDSIKFINEAKKRGIRIIGHGFGRDYLKAFSPYLDDFLAGNEPNMPYIQGTVNLEQAFSDYRRDEFDIGYQVIKQEYKKNHVCAGIAAGQTVWYDMMSRVWNQFDIIALHPYGYPHSPDYPTATPMTWHVEQGLQRHKAALKKYGWKPTYITEAGAPTVPLNSSAMDLRTQADYNTRTFILGLAYGVQVVSVYCFTDYSNAGYGTDLNDVEYHFGNFYYDDYFGRIMPKPSAAAFAGMTRQLESVLPNTEHYQAVNMDAKYNKGTVRAFQVATKEKGSVLVAWSNCAPLPNDNPAISRPPRNPNLPWNNQWAKSENVSFDAVGADVTVADVMGNTKTYQAKNGKVSIPLSGSPVYIYGVK